MRSRALASSNAMPERLDLQAFLPYRLLLVTDRLSQIYARRYAAEFGITIPESRVLTVVTQFGPLSSREICARTAMVKSRVSVAVSRLVAAGLMTRSVDPEDGRLLRLKLSREGEALYRRIVPVALEIEEGLIAAIGASGRNALMRLLSEVERASARRGAAEPG
jgi:DNA-binding MarR family transcriptional regulator